MTVISYVGTLILPSKILFYVSSKLADEKSLYAHSIQNFIAQPYMTLE